MLSISMLFFNPLKFFVFPFVFLVALPLALCAGVTTIVAFLVLFLRLFLVYFDVGLETLRYILIGHATHTRYITSQRTPVLTPGASTTTSTLVPPQAVVNTRHRQRVNRRGSSGLLASAPSGTEGFSAIAPSIGLERDFEGVGGWRLDSNDTDNPEEQQWYILNSRLESPYRRHHYRSQSGGAVLSGHNGPGIMSRPESMTRSHSPEHSRRSSTPSRSSSRTPTIKICPEFTKADQEDYFS
ncbi:hypothetical protein F5B22DRAFT_178357 [Xylaria bambusicola]|uniref:uncharacterized protein n=1 Tax=Xylaria bambusicola TaxID=326684 RepID=UPI00200841A8|nr:uncharacterized protein F5B22DRAFT_178357 [Xylaria bambusicola]KAI0516731.1 hypothetical protein F5B22DRAFT_178357 [Xylaria bambusicola]